MGCGGSTPDTPDTPHTSPPNGFHGSTESAMAWRTDGGAWAKGVGTAFEFLNEQRQWQLISDREIINKLGQLCAKNNTKEVLYTAGSNTYSTTQGNNGLLSQKNVATGVTRTVRLVPFFFEFEEGPRHWLPVTDPDACMALTAVLASSTAKTYQATSAATAQRHSYEAQLIDDMGLILQRNVQTGKLRRVRPTPIGPDGKPHFEFLENGHVWTTVDEVCVRILAVAATGGKDGHYTIGPWTYRVRLGDNGFIDQQNTSTKKERKLRPAPWLGHGGPRVADPTNRYVPREETMSPTPVPMGAPVSMGAPVPMGAPAPMGMPMGGMPMGGMPMGGMPMGGTPMGGMPMGGMPMGGMPMGGMPMGGMPMGGMYGSPGGLTTTTTTTTTMAADPMMMMQMQQMGMQTADQFYVPDAVPMGSVEAPLQLDPTIQMAQPVGQPVYYYKPEVMEPAA